MNNVSVQVTKPLIPILIDAAFVGGYHDFIQRRSIGQPRAVSRPRKVRAPESAVPGNSRTGKPVAGPQRHTAL